MNIVKQDDAFAEFFEPGHCQIDDLLRVVATPVLFLGVGACMLIALWIGDRTEREDPDQPHESLEPSHV